MIGFLRHLSQCSNYFNNSDRIYTTVKNKFIKEAVVFFGGYASSIYEDRFDYKPVRFFPTTPSDRNACYCNIVLQDNLLNTEKGEYFKNNMIIEFRYDIH